MNKKKCQRYGIALCLSFVTFSAQAQYFTQSVVEKYVDVFLCRVIHEAKKAPPTVNQELPREMMVQYLGRDQVSLWAQETPENERRFSSFVAHQLEVFSPLEESLKKENSTEAEGLGLVVGPEGQLLADVSGGADTGLKEKCQDLEEKDLKLNVDMAQFVETLASMVSELDPSEYTFVLGKLSMHLESAPKDFPQQPEALWSALETLFEQIHAITKNEIRRGLEARPAVSASLGTLTGVIALVTASGGLKRFSRSDYGAKLGQKFASVARYMRSFFKRKKKSSENKLEDVLTELKELNRGHHSSTVATGTGTAGSSQDAIRNADREQVLALDRRLQDEGNKHYMSRLWAAKKKYQKVFGEKCPDDLVLTEINELLREKEKVTSLREQLDLLKKADLEEGGHHLAEKPLKAWTDMGFLEKTRATFVPFERLPWGRSLSYNAGMYVLAGGTGALAYLYFKHWSKEHRVYAAGPHGLLTLKQMEYVGDHIRAKSEALQQNLDLLYSELMYVGKLKDKVKQLQDELHTAEKGTVVEQGAQEFLVALVTQIKADAEEVERLQRFFHHFKKSAPTVTAGMPVAEVHPEAISLLGDAQKNILKLVAAMQNSGLRLTLKEYHKTLETKGNQATGDDAQGSQIENTPDLREDAGEDDAD